MDAPFTVNERFERVWDLGWKMPYFGHEVEKAPRPSAIQVGEYVILPNGNDILRVEHVDIEVNYTCNSHGWRVVAYVNTGLKGPSGWKHGEVIRLEISYYYIAHAHPKGLHVKRTHEFFTTGSYWKLKEVVAEYEAASRKIGMMDPTDTKMEDEPNPFEEGSVKYLAWEHMWPSVVEDYRSENPEEEEGEDYDPEWEDRKRIVEELSCLPDGLTGSEARDIMLDY